VNRNQRVGLHLYLNFPSIYVVKISSTHTNPNSPLRGSSNKAKAKAYDTCVAPQAAYRYRNCRGAVHVTDMRRDYRP